MVSILLATYRSKREWLDRAIQSVKAQSYDNWELCICDDASNELWLTEYLETHRVADSRVKVASAPMNGGIAAALTCAGKLAAGELVTFLDHDDELHVHALHYLVEAFQEEDVDLVYTDEDHLDVDGARTQPLLKPVEHLTGNQASVAGLPHLSHPALADQREDLVRTQFFAYRERHISDAAKFIQSGSG